jgi:serine phosphatase RsbU (regulator of sigma subunit)
MDTNFVTTVTRKLSFFAGSGLISYPFAPLEWQQFLFDIQLFQKEKETKIYPFGFLSLNEDWSIQSIRSETDQEQPRIIIMGREDIFGNQKFIAGRVFMPVLNSVTANQAYFAFDVYVDFTSVFRPSTTGQIAWILLVVFLLFNSFVIGQVSKVGAQINRIILDRFAHLKQGIQEIARGNFDHKFTMEGEDEFVELAGHFNHMGQQLKETIAQAREKDRLDHELKIARQVQLSLLPSKLPELRNFQVAASIKTANEIGGDFYDILELSKNKYLFTIGDVSGKGSSAAFYMAQFISLFRYSRQFSEKPDEIAIRMNKYFSTQIVDRQIFITAIIGVFDLESNQVELVRAGHTLPMLVPGDSERAIGELKLSGIGLGLTRTEQTFRKKIHTERITMNPGDMLVFYTDGVIEAAHPSIKAEDESEMIVYGEERFKDLISNSRDLPASDLISICVSDLNTFYSDYSPVDDYTLFIIQRQK